MLGLTMSMTLAAGDAGRMGNHGTAVVGRVMGGGVRTIIGEQVRRGTRWHRG